MAVPRLDRTQRSSRSFLLAISLVANAMLAATVYFNSNTLDYASTMLYSREEEEAESPSVTVASSGPDLSRIIVDSSGQQDFFEIAKDTHTDKVRGELMSAKCITGFDEKQCRPAKNPKCRVGHNHFYHTMYNRWLGAYSKPDSEPFQFLEIGYFNGGGFDAYTKFLPAAEKHSMEISCIEEGPRAEGKWPWGNFAAKNVRYQELLDANRLHCGDASSWTFLNKEWTKEMKRPDAPPLKVVIDDGAHLSEHMATSLFFWFPRIEPGGILVVEDVQPISIANKFRTHILPQVMKDLHYCGADDEMNDEVCFPTIQPLLAAVHCEMHICVFVRNEQPAWEPSEQESMPPANAFKAQECLFKH